MLRYTTRGVKEAYRLQAAYMQTTHYLVVGRFISSGAEREGFEPPDLLQSTVFKTAAFDHSAISPGAKLGVWMQSTK